MDANSIMKEDKNILDLTDEINDPHNGNHQEVIVVDGRGYKKGSSDTEEVYTLIDVIDDNQTSDKINIEIMARSEEIIERIARKIVPEIAERIIREEIEKLKKAGDTE
jgi:carbon monoxide dehydrogenase subunit G